MASNEVKVRFLDLKDVEAFVEVAKRIALRHPDTEDDLATMLELAMPALKVKNDDPRRLGNQAPSGAAEA